MCPPGGEGAVEVFSGRIKEESAIKIIIQTEGLHTRRDFPFKATMGWTWRIKRREGGKGNEGKGIERTHLDDLTNPQKGAKKKEKQHISQEKRGNTTPSG